MPEQVAAGRFDAVLLGELPMADRRHGARGRPAQRRALAEIGWGTVSGTTWRSDVDRDLTTILFTPASMTYTEPPAIFVDLWTGSLALAHRQWPP